MNWELADVQAGFRNGKETRDQIANIRWIIEKQENSRKTSTSLLTEPPEKTVCCDPHKGFGVVNKAEVDVFLEFSCFFDDPTDVGNLISGFFAVSKSSLNICKFSVHVLLSPAWRILSINLLAYGDYCNCAVVWIFFGIAFLWDWSENWSFSVLWPLLSFPNLLAYWVQHFHSIIF